VLVQVLLEVSQALQILVQLGARRIGDEHDCVDALQDELTRGVVVDLTGHRVEQEARAVSVDLAQFERQEVEEERSIGLRLHRDHLALGVVGRLLVDELKIGRLAAHPGAVVDDLGVDLAARIVQHDHVVASFRLASRARDRPGTACAIVDRRCSAGAAHRSCSC
jgi:hypothetical protein